MSKLKIVQQSQVNWQIQTPSGHVLQRDITIASPHEAERFIKGYISSFTNWTYEVVPIKKEVRK